MTHFYANETALVHGIVKALEARCRVLWVLKVHGGSYQRAGVPDLLVCAHGRLLGLEAKHQKPGESRAHMLSRVTLLQHTELDALAGAGAVAAVVASVDDALTALDQICTCNT